MKHTKNTKNTHITKEQHMSTLSIERVITVDDFKHAFRHHPAGVAIITADIGDGPVAMTVSSLFSVSVEPPTLAFSASAISSATPTIRQADTLVVHLVASQQAELAKLGATSGVDRFGASVHWDRLDSGEPYYPEAASWLRGRVTNRIDAGGSTLIVVEALEAKPRDSMPASEDERPLVYHNRTWHTIGEHSRLD